MFYILFYFQVQLNLDSFGFSYLFQSLPVLKDSSGISWNCLGANGIILLRQNIILQSSVVQWALDKEFLSVRSFIFLCGLAYNKYLIGICFIYLFFFYLFYRFNLFLFLFSFSQLLFLFDFYYLIVCSHCVRGNDFIVIVAVVENMRQLPRPPQTPTRPEPSDKKLRVCVCRCCCYCCCFLLSWMRWRRQKSLSRRLQMFFLLRYPAKR